MASTNALDDREKCRTLILDSLKENSNVPQLKVRIDTTTGELTFDNI